VTRAVKPSDLELIQAYLAGDVSAFDTLFKRYHKAIFGLTFRLLRDRQLAEDLTQETFFQILRTIHRINETFNFSAWIHRIATNLCYDELRRRKKFPEVQDADDEETEAAVLQVPDRDMHKSPEMALEIHELRDAVYSVACRLPEKYRLVLTLRELQGLSYANIARQMGVSESAVETLLHRARRRFKEEYLYLEGKAQSEENRCTTIVYLLENFPAGTLRREQRKMVAQHLEFCENCARRYPHPVAVRLPVGPIAIASKAG
jgi:RNA polymerase sigma-70 factor (ECF subfamily)